MRAAVVLLLTLVSGVTLAQSPDPKQLLEKAIAFHGGKDALASLPDVKQTGTIETAGRSAGRRSRPPRSPGRSRPCCHAVAAMCA